MTEEKPLTRKEVLHMIAEKLHIVSAHTHASIAPAQVFQLQADATLSQNTPASGTKYEVLATTPNVRVASITVTTTSTTTATNLEAHVTIDGNSLVYATTNPTTTTVYHARHAAANPEATQQLNATQLRDRPYILEGRSVKVEAEATGGTVSNLTCRVKYYKIP